MAGEYRWNKTVFCLLCSLISLAITSSCTTTKHDDPRHLTALVSVEGSDTMSSLVDSWASNFMKKETNIPVSVTTANTTQGVEALINRTTDIAAASGEITEEQKARAKKNHVVLQSVVVARDCVAIIVNPANTVSELTLDQVRGILSGSIQNWNQVGGKSSAIKLFVREEESGTNKFIKEHFLRGISYGKGARTQLSAEAVIEAVRTNKSAVGYVGMGAVFQSGPKIKVLGLKLLPSSKAVMPSANSSFSDYPLCRSLLLYTDETPKPSVEQFVKYCLSSEGQKIARQCGFATVHKDGD